MIITAFLCLKEKSKRPSVSETFTLTGKYIAPFNCVLASRDSVPANYFTQSCNE